MNPRWLLVSDVDDTLVGEDGALADLVRSLAEVRSVVLALNSSRPIRSVLRTLEGLSVRVRPVAIIGAMGTEIECDGRPLDAYQARFAGWSRAPVDVRARTLGLERHDDEFQTPYKASFAVRDSEVADEFLRALEDVDPPCRVVRSGESDVDVLPARAGKGAATLHLASHLGVSADGLVVAGDSANDLDMFRAAKKGIVVGNARAELRDALDPSAFYFASRTRAGGLLEGLRHYGAVPDPRS